MQMQAESSDEQCTQFFDKEIVAKRHQSSPVLHDEKLKAIDDLRGMNAKSSDSSDSITDIESINKYHMRPSYENIQHDATSYHVSSLTNSIDILIENNEYFYAYPAFPNPAKGVVRSHIYWDMRTDIEQCQIGVYDINGNQVAGKSEILIEKLSEYNGYLTWDCSGVPDGVYLIYINHGKIKMPIKVIVSR